MTIEITVSTYNRPDEMKVFLDSVLSLSLMPNKILIVDAGTKSINYNDYENILAEKNIILKVIKTPCGLTLARNIGIINSTCDLVLFSDDDVVLEKDYFIEAIKVFENDKMHEIGGLTGNLENFKLRVSKLPLLFRKLFYLPIDSEGKILKSGWANGLNYFTKSSGEICWLNGCNMFFRKEVFDYFLFDENLKRFSIEDLDYSIRVSKKYKLFYCVSAKYSHFPSSASRIGNRDKYLMLMRNHHYLYVKNIKQNVKSDIPHNLSLIGIVLQSLFLQRTIQGFIGASRGLLEIVFLKNYTMPNYGERLDNSIAVKTTIAEHLARYEFGAQYGKNKIVLDCICGGGIGTNVLRKESKEVYGVDINEATCETAKKKITFSNAFFKQGSATDLPFQDNFFETITSMETLEHIPLKMQEKCIAEFHRTLIPGGILVLSTPNKDMVNPNGIAPKNYFHLHELTYDELYGLLSKYFKNVSPFGLINPLRDSHLIKGTKELNLAPNKLTFRKFLLLIIPFSIKNFLSRIIKGRNIYPSKEEYIISDKNVKIAYNIIFVAEK
jgi:ubiquinone/menaquinone biosynthesis C-methylase UbiE/GT2 family glycosyltransferase